MLSTRPVSSRLAFGADPRMRSSRMEEISAEAAEVGAEVESFWARMPAAAPFLVT